VQILGVCACVCVCVCVQGWLGRSEYALGEAAGLVTSASKAQVVRWWQDLVAWASDTALMVGAGADPGAALLPSLGLVICETGLGAGGALVAGPDGVGLGCHAHSRYCR